MRAMIPELMLLAAVTAMAQEVVDRVAVSLDQRVITLSAIKRQMRMNAYLDGRQPEDSPEARRAAAERLIDQALVRREMSLSRYTPIPMADVRKNLDAYREKLGLPEEAFAAQLERYGFTPDDLLQELYWQATLLRFVQFRFSLGVQVSDEEVLEYYEKEFVPSIRQMAPGQEPPPLAEVRDRVAGIVASRKEDAVLEDWLQQGRQLAKIRFHEEAFK
jgi:peptidyl-prolyl cis-trans isomerase SurA